MKLKLGLKAKEEITPSSNALIIRIFFPSSYRLEIFLF